MSYEPLVCEADIHQQGHDDETEGCCQKLLNMMGEAGTAQSHADSQSTLPAQHEGALRGASLAMATQLDEEEQESGAHDAQTQAQQGCGEWRHS